MAPILLEKYTQFIEQYLKFYKIYADTCCKLINKLDSLEQKYKIQKPSDINNPNIPLEAKKEIINTTHTLSSLVKLYENFGTPGELYKLTKYNHYNDFKIINFSVDKENDIKNNTALLLDKFKEGKNFLYGVKFTFKGHAEPGVIAYNKDKNLLIINHNNFPKDDLDSEPQESWATKYTTEFLTNFNQVINNIKEIYPSLEIKCQDMGIPVFQHGAGGYCSFYAV